ncbi:uncharacterized protein LOC125948550 [Anopheles darlingi]|uniref:uncharacterized protein LOC125948550 n=1 Tax=Anopheles darlingi TaxID=43151 RepID=UPI0021000C32|nr:uncharacterized protein LOC125948550 [Anopheles darlingi]
MDFVFKAFFLQFLVLGLLLQVVRPQTGGTDCRGKDYLCLDDVRFQLCVDYGDGRPVTVNDEVQQCPTGTFCSNGGHYECDSFVPPATTAAPQVADVTETEVPAEEVTTSVPVEVEEATLPPVEEPEPEVAVPEPSEEPAQEPVTTTTEAEVPEVTEAQDSSVAPETTVGVVEEEELVTEATAPATEPVEVEEETTTTGTGPAVTEEVETTEEAATEEVVAATTEPSQPEVPEVTEAAPEPEQETEGAQEQETTVGADVEVTTTAAPEQEEQTETESSVATDAPVEEGEAGPEEPVVTEAPATTENVETQAPVEPSTTVTEETSEVVSESTTDLPEVEVPVTTAAPEEEAASSTVPETTPAPVVPTEEPSNSESGGSDEGESSQGSAQESTEQPSVESGSGSDEAATTTTTTSPVAPSDAPFVCTAAGRFPHPTDCHKYYICFWLPFGLYNLEQNCLAGFAYNPTLERCTADQSVCFPGQFTCTAPGRFPDPADPTKYFWCVWNAFGGYLQYGLQCPLGQVFNQFRGRCAFIVAGRSLDAEEPLLTGEEEWTNGPEEQNAVLPPVAPVEPLAPQVEPVTPKLKVKFECLEEGTFADPNNCARYFVCTLKKLDKFKKSKFKCITGERFDALVGACVPDLDALCE